MNRLACAVLLGLSIVLPAFAVDPPKIAGDEGATYDDLIREKTLVTILLKSGAPDSNVRITAIYPSAATPTIAVETSTGERTAYTFANISAVRVQKERIRTKEKPDPETVLTAEDKIVVTRATARAMTFLKESHNQRLKMDAAVILAAGDHANKADALSYLRQLTASNDAPTALFAALALWEVGETPENAVLLAGLASGNRGAKALAAQLAGLSDAQGLIVEIRALLRDPSVEIFPAAAMALGRLGDRASLPQLFDALSTITDEKAEAAVVALSSIGGPDVVQKLQEMLPTAKGSQWIRIVRTLHALGDQNATRLLETEAMGQPGFQRETAIILAEQGSPEAMTYLREFLKKQIDPDVENLVYRAFAALALYSAGDIQQKSTLSTLLNITPEDIYARGKTSDKQFKENAVREIQRRTCAILGKSLRRDMLPMLAAPLESPDPVVALAAAEAIVSISNHDFGKRSNTVAD